MEYSVEEEVPKDKQQTKTRRKYREESYEEFKETDWEAELKCED